MVLPLGDAEKTRIVPVVTYALIALNVVIYLYQQEQPDSFTVAYAATPYEISHNVDLEARDIMRWADAPDEHAEAGHFEPEHGEIPQETIPIPVWLTLFTSMFLHGSPLHLAGNMLYLWIFGDNVEEVLGAARYVILYLLSGLLGTLLQIAANPDSLIPTLGASGAIAGVMGAYVIWFPRNRVRVLALRFIVEMPALVVIGFWILLQIWVSLGSFSQTGQAGGVAYLAHVGGAATGIAAAFLYRKRAREIILRNSRAGWPDLEEVEQIPPPRRPYL